METRILLLGHGTVESLDDLPPFLANIRRGRPAPPELLHEIRRRYETIGGSPLLRISRELAQNLAEKLGERVHLAMRFWHPFARDVLREISEAGCGTLTVVPLAPYSGHVYGGEMQRLAEEQRSSGPPPPELRCAPSWGQEPLLVRGFAGALRDALARLPDARRAAAHVLFTAHSLPLAIVEKGDPYPREVEATATAVAALVKLTTPWRVVYQSQGATPDPWLGPDVRESLADIARQGAKDAIVCPIGFLGDHVEILYDLDVEAKHLAQSVGLTLWRTDSLNASAPLVDALAAVASRLHPFGCSPGS
jgi:protoporphyrin/coproporphyrin ferrochelatase